MTQEEATKVKESDVITFNGEAWTVIDTCEGDDGILISAERDGAYEMFDYRDVSST
jgi:hypothetical protein